MTRDLQLDFYVGPAGWLRCDWPAGRAFVCFRRGRGRRLVTAALFQLEPTRESLRDLPLHRIEVAANAGGDLTRTLHARLDEPQVAIGSAAFVAAFTGFAKPEPKLVRPAGRRLDDDWYRQVAEVYIAAKDRGEKPRAAVARLAGVSTDVAGRWIYEARKRGHLAPTRPGRVSA